MQGMRSKKQDKKPVPMWDQPKIDAGPAVVEGGSHIILRLTPDLDRALQARSPGEHVPDIALRALHEWAGVPQEGPSD